MGSCSLTNLVCNLNDLDLLNSSSHWSHDGRLEEGLFGKDVEKPHSYHNEPSRSHFYTLFRKAAVSHGFGSEYQSELRKFMGERWTDSWMIWTLAMPGTFIMGVLAQLLLKKVFARLRMPERQHTRERLWNYAFYKFIFIFGVVNVESMEEMIIWVAWFILLGYIHFFIVLSRDRCEYMTFSPVPAKNAHRRIVALLATIIGFSLCVIGFSCYLLWAGFFHTGLFTAAEGMLMLMPSWHILLRYGYHHLRQGKSTAKWEKRTALYYHLNICFEIGTLIVDLLHHAHMMCQVCSLSASSLVIVAQIRFLIMDFISKYRRHRNYIAIRRRLQQTYPLATDDEIERHGCICSICWDCMEDARKLHCGHLFHESCLLSWLEQDISCPICRVTLTSTFNITGRAANRAESGGPTLHFNGSRFIRWLPNISVTVSHPSHEYTDAAAVELMAEQVHQVFPNIAHNLIIQDLLETGSAEMTIDNVLNGIFDFSQPATQLSPGGHSEDPPRRLTTLNIGGTMREIPDTPEACRALQIQRRETLVYEARKKFLAKIAMEKASNPVRSLGPS